MTTAPARRPFVAPVAEENAKRRQIIAGARALFLAQGFDAASMDAIARKAGVSKGTLYVYFESKEQLFEAIVEDERGAQAEQIFALDADNRNVAAVLTNLGTAYARFLCRRQKRPRCAPSSPSPSACRNSGASSTSSDPSAASSGWRPTSKPSARPACSRWMTARWPPHSSSNSCQSTMFKPVMFGSGAAPTDERIAHVVGTAVRTFLAAYAKR